MARPRTGGTRRGEKRIDGRIPCYVRFTDQTGTRREECVGHDLTDTELSQKLDDKLYEVRKGTYVPIERREPDPPQGGDTFLHVMSMWLSEQGVEWTAEGRFLKFTERESPPAEGEGLAEKTQADLFWRCQKHLRPFFGLYPPNEITAQLIDRYRNQKRQHGLSAPSINKTINTLAAILDLAHDYGLLGDAGHPAHGKRRRAKENRREREQRRLKSWADYDPLMILLEAAHDLDVNSKHYPNLGRLPMLAIYFLAGPRTSELLLADRRHVDLTRRTIDVGLKTVAGLRGVLLVDVLHALVGDWMVQSPFQAPSDALFPTYDGRRRTKDNLRQRIFLPCISRAQAILEEAEADGRPRLQPDGTPIELPPRIVPYSGRRTAVTFMVEAGWDLGAIQDQIGHTDGRLTTSVYRQRRHRRKDPRIVELMRYPGTTSESTAVRPAVENVGAVVLPFLAGSMRQSQASAKSGPIGVAA